MVTLQMRRLQCSNQESNHFEWKVEFALDAEDRVGDVAYIVYCSPQLTVDACPVWAHSRILSQLR